MNFINFMLNVVFSILFSVALFYTDKINDLRGASLLKKSGVDIITTSDISSIFLIFIPVFLCVWFVLKNVKSFTIKRTLNLKDISVLKVGFCLFLFWFPFLLVFYPAPGMNDTYYILKYPMGCSVQHPFYYCMYLGILGKLSLKFFGTEALGLFISVLLQMAFMAFSIGFSIKWIYEKLKNTFLAYVLIFYFAFLPIIGNYAIAAVKDTIFSVTLLLWIPFLYDVLVEKKSIVQDKLMKYYFIVISVLTLTMRNNGKYIFVVLALWLVFNYTKERRNIIKISIICLILCSIPNFYLGVFGNRPQLLQEAVAVPMQQIARTIAVDGVVTEEQKAYLNNWMPLEKIKKSYNVFTVDTIKWNNDFNRKFFNSHSKEFFKYWSEIWTQNKKVYLEAWLLQTFGCWAVDTQDWIDQSRFGFSLTHEILKRGVTPSENNKFKVGSFPISQSVKETLGKYMFYNTDYINPGNCFWITLFIGLILVNRKRYMELSVLLPILLCWGTLILAVPATFVYRYAFMYPLSLPFLILIPFISKEKLEDKNV